MLASDEFPVSALKRTYFQKNATPRHKDYFFNDSQEDHLELVTLKYSDIDSRIWPHHLSLSAYISVYQRLKNIILNFKSIIRVSRYKINVFVAFDPISGRSSQFFSILIGHLAPLGRPSACSAFCTRNMTEQALGHPRRLSDFLIAIHKR